MAIALAADARVEAVRDRGGKIDSTSEVLGSGVAVKK
jgi:hypothetical protein